MNTENIETRNIYIPLRLMLNKNILEENFFILLAVLSLHAGFGSINGQKSQNDNLFMNSQEIVFKLCNFFFLSIQHQCLSWRWQLKLRTRLWLPTGKVWKAKVTQSCPLCYPMDYTVHGILQARILEWIAVPFSGGSSQPRDQTQVSCIAGRCFTNWATRKVLFSVWAH